MIIPAVERPSMSRARPLTGNLSRVMQLVNLCFDATEPVRLARFWASALGWEIDDDTADEIGVLPTDGTRFILVFLPVPEPKAERARSISIWSASPSSTSERSSIA